MRDMGRHTPRLYCFIERFSYTENTDLIFTIGHIISCLFIVVVYTYLQKLMLANYLGNFLQFLKIIRNIMHKTG